MLSKYNNSGKSEDIQDIGYFYEEPEVGEECGIAYSVIHSPTFGSISSIWSNLFSNGSAKSSATTE